MRMWRTLLCLSVLLGVPALSNARGFSNGYCQYGNIATQSGAIPLTNCVITVTNFYTGATASIFSDNSGTVLANPFTVAGSAALFTFYADDGTYTLLITGTLNNQGEAKSVSFKATVTILSGSSVSGPNIPADKTVATLPGSPATGDKYTVTDGNGYSCTSGGGSTRAICRWNGASWEVINQGSGAAPAFSAVTAGTNAAVLHVGTGGTLDATGTGSISATALNGTALSGLATGIVKNTTATGVPSIAVAGDFPTLNQNTSGTAANLSGTPALPNGTTATTQAALDNTTKIATDAFVLANAVTNPMTTLGDELYGGASGVPTRLAGPTTPNGVPQYLVETPAAGAATAETFQLAGVPINAQTGTTYTVAVTDRASYVSFSNASAIAVTLPQAGTAGFTSNFVFVACDIGAGTATITPNATSTISYTNGSAYTSAAANLPLTTGQCAWIYSDNTNYFAILRSGGAGSSAWSALTNPSGNLVLSTMGTNTTTFDYATALANAWIWANNTAATSGTSQSSPLIYLCGQGWETATPANTQDCYSFQVVIPNGANSQPTLNVVNTGGSTSAAGPGIVLPATAYVATAFAVGNTSAQTATYGGTIGFGNGGGIRWANGGNWSTSTPDTSTSRLAPGLVGVGGGSLGTQTGILVDGNTQRQAAANYTNATTTPSTFQTWTFQNTAAQNYSYSCHGSWQGSVSTATLALSINSSVAPTSAMAHARIFSTLTGTSTDATVTTTASGTVAVLTGAAPAANATNYEFYIEGTIEEPGAGGTFAIQAAAGGVGTLTILRGSFCQLY